MGIGIPFLANKVDYFVELRSLVMSILITWTVEGITHKQNFKWNATIVDRCCIAKSEILVTLHLVCSARL